MKHFIAKQQIDLVLPSTDHAWKLQQEVSQLYWREIIHRIEKVFDQYSTREKVIHLDRLEIDLGRITASDLNKSTLLFHIEKTIEKALKEQLTKIALEEGSEQSILTSDFEKWLYFLEYGYFNWSINQPSEKWQENVLAALASEMKAITELRECYHQSKIVRERLILQHPIHFLKTIVEVFTAQKQQQLIPWINELLQLQQVKTGNESSLNTFLKPANFWKITFDEVILNKKKTTTELLIQNYLVKAIPSSEMRNFTTQINALEKQAQLLLNAVEVLNFQAKKNQEQALQPSLLSEKTVVQTEINEQNPAKNAEKELTDFEFNESTIIPKDGIYIHHAGIILLHPFIARFFETLGLTQEGEFCDTRSREQAIYLLHYLATGDTTSPEYEMVLPKLMCGLPLNTPIAPVIDFPTNFLEEAEELLEVVVQHWGALGEVTNASLREAFLQRSGKLEQAQTGILLTIEKETLDILLEQLPWNLSIVKLPWMEDILKIDWR